uniref:Uncharacterized protein n=1 Tax=Hanusia phi TaxID=3032 RepID=A0A7S0E057_9CRYP|mmetsp:Transcript_14041/g.32351  ORF Transcript_14041/g.32351 Transcript_14041/m.32351 type:complete len:657 (+) Transcript_14041:139-2109(+)
MNNLYSTAALLSAAAGGKSVDTPNILCLDSAGSQSISQQSLGAFLKNHVQNVALNPLCMPSTQAIPAHQLLNSCLPGTNLPDTNTPQIFFPIAKHGLATLGNLNAPTVPNSFGLMATNQDLSTLIQNGLTQVTGNILNKSQFVNIGSQAYGMSSQTAGINSAALNSSLPSTSALSPFLFNAALESNLSSLGMQSSSPANIFQANNPLPDSSLHVTMPDTAFQSRLASSISSANPLSSLHLSQIPNAQFVAQHSPALENTDTLGKRSQSETAKNPFDQLADSYEGYNRRVKMAKKAGDLKGSSKLEIDATQEGSTNPQNGGDDQAQDSPAGQSTTKVEHRSVSRKRLGILHDRRGRLREVEDLFLDCLAMRPYIELGYSSQALLSAFADTRGVLLDSIREAASIAQSATDTLASQGRFPSKSAAEQAQRMREKQSWICFEFDPASGKRKTISCGPTLSDIVGIPGDDLIAKFYAHEVRLPCSEIDFVCFVIEDLLRCLDSATTHFVVHTKGSSWMRQGKDADGSKLDQSKSDLLTKESGAYDAEVLTVSQVFERDERGRLVRMTALYAHANEDDYKKILSSASPPLTVHTRDGKDFQSMLWRHKVAIQCVGKLLHIKKSPEGRAKLMALANSIRERANDLKCKIINGTAASIVKSQE